MDILELAGCTRVLELAEMMGQTLARRVIGRDAKTHVIGQFDGLLIAEASVAGTPLVNRTLSDIRLRDHVNINVAGVWQRGRFETAGPDTLVTASTVLVLAGSRRQLDGVRRAVLHLSGQRRAGCDSGRRPSRLGATARGLDQQGIDYRIVEKSPDHFVDDGKHVLGDAADLEILKTAGIMESTAVVITTHDDALNVYLTLYCRRLRSDIQIISRADLGTKRSLRCTAPGRILSFPKHRWVPMQFSTCFAAATSCYWPKAWMFSKSPFPSRCREGRSPKPPVRRETGCSVIAITNNGDVDVNPNPQNRLPTEAEMIVDWQCRIGAAIPGSLFENDAAVVGNQGRGMGQAGQPNGTNECGGTTLRMLHRATTVSPADP